MTGKMDDETPKWMTEGDKLRLKREGLDFIDWTGRDRLVDSTFEPSASRCEGFSRLHLVPLAD